MIPQEADQTHIEYGFPVLRSDSHKRSSICIALWDTRGRLERKLVYTVLNRKVMKPKTVFVKRRCFKNFDKEAFNKDLDNVPFEAAYIFDDTSDVCWAWETMYKSVLDALWTITLR